MQSQHCALGVTLLLTNPTLRELRGRESIYTVYSTGVCLSVLPAESRSGAGSLWRVEMHRADDGSQLIAARVRLRQ